MCPEPPFAGTHLFDAIAMMNVNVNVKHTPMVFEQLEDCKHDVVRIAKS